MSVQILLNEWGFTTLRDVAEFLALEPTESVEAMAEAERVDGIEQMLTDLHQLATRDGCIAAAWALEFAIEQAGDIREYE